MDAQLTEKIVHEVKSQGVFDEFRKDSMADVDTKPAYQNLRHRVENTVKKFLSEQKWTLETNKNQLREKLRRHITESGFLDVGVERIVDQVVNPKIGSVFQPRIEEIAYKYLGLPTPPRKFEPPPPPLMHPLPPLPLNAPPLKVETSSLLPTDLEQVSPDSDNVTVKSEKMEDRTAVDMDTEEKFLEDDDESPPFEPLVKYETKQIKDDVKEENQLKMNIKAEICESAVKTENAATNNSKSEVSHYATEVDKEASMFVDARISQDSQLSTVSSDSCLSTNLKNDSLERISQEAVAANISEEAQMPKFSETSCEAITGNGESFENISSKSELHFDIKKDEIKFEGTERKNGLTTLDPPGIKCEEKYLAGEELVSHENNCFKFSTNKTLTENKEEDCERTPNAQELSFGSSIEDSSSVPPSCTPKKNFHNKEKNGLPQMQTPKQVARSSTPTAIIITPPLPTLPVTTSSLPSLKSERDLQSRYSSSSSSKHKKHSKERRKSHEREKEKDNRERYRSSKEIKDSSKYHSSSGTKSSSSKHSSSSSSSKYSSSHNRNNEKDLEKYSTCSTHSSLKHTKQSHFQSSSSSNENQESKKSKRDSDRRHHYSSSSSSKRNERKDDHTEAKHKVQRRKSTDSNDDDDCDKNVSGGTKYASQYKSSYSLSVSKSTKSSGSENKSSTSKTNGVQKDQTETKEFSQESPSKYQHLSNVVILTDLLKNPETQFIQLNSKGYTVQMPVEKPGPDIETEAIKSISGEFNNNTEIVSLKGEHHIQDIETSSTDLLYFDEIQFNTINRLKLLNDTMDLCRDAINSFRFDSFTDEGIELSNEEDGSYENNKINMITEALKRSTNYNYEELEATPKKRCISSESEGRQSKPSPTPSDTSSVNSKENEEVDKNACCDKKSILERHKVVQKLTQQQRYSSEDLYKPRPILSQRSRRRRMDSIA